MACVASMSALQMRTTVRPAVSSRSSVITMKTYASIKEAQADIAAQEAAAAAPVKAVKAPREARAPREVKPREVREPRAAKAPKAKAAPPAPPVVPLTAAQQRAAMEAELATIQASRKAAEAELKALKSKRGGGGSSSASLPSVTLPSLPKFSAPKFELTAAGSDASPLTGPGAYGLGAGLALGLAPAGALIGFRAFLMQRK